ncbi:hypothetical protein [Geobacter sp. SVR]|uniref:hypothetical protein n=1 Tax=Geobacter sp. SVR TaxID=2495594 RepID=UPI00143EF832|nr:hypothetical protein [Geobacter sp. SVR]BCS52493.1 hypothetical protein GSVR_08010 [Geobacter sp. SVR]GCF84070.1 hypothetical protein GSbR_06700 [Geobacter sp. SVR]
MKALIVVWGTMGANDNLRPRFLMLLKDIASTRRPGRGVPCGESAFGAALTAALGG